MSASLKKLIGDNSAAIVAGVSVGGVSKEIYQLTKSILTSSAGHGLHVATVVTDGREWYDTPPIKANVRRQSQQSTNEKVLYSCEFHISDYAELVQDEGPGQANEHFETANAAFDTVVDRIVKVLRDNPNITPASGSYIIELEDPDDESRAIEREERHYTVEDARGARDVFYSILRFRCTTCGEPDP
jgi:hypothetical protein